MNINFENASGPCTEGYQYYEYGNGEEDMNDYAYGNVNEQAHIFEIAVGSNYEEEINKILENNNFWFSEEFVKEREVIRNKKEEEKRIAADEKIKAKKMAEYLKLQKELGLNP